MNLLQRTCLAACLILAPLAGCGDDDEKKGPSCGDGEINGEEQCDPGSGEAGPNVGTETCASVTMMSTSTGTLGCSSTCMFVTTNCRTPSTGGTGGTAMGGMGGTVMGGMGGMTGGTGGGGTGGSGEAGPPAEAGPGDAAVDSSADGATMGMGMGMGGP